MATKTTAAKKTTTKKVESPKAETPRVIKAGGKKGEAIVAALTKDPSQSRSQLAETVGATVGRVGEVIRHLAANGTDEEKALIAKHNESKPARKVAEKKANPTPAAPGKKATASKTTAGSSVKKATASRTRRQAAKKTAEPSPANA